VVHAGVNRLEAFEVVKYVLAHGQPAARRGAARSLMEFRGAEANQLVLRCLEDRDSEVRASVVRQLRDRGIPNAMQRLLELVSSPEASISRAARESLAEFSFERFLASFDLLNDDVARSTGSLVRRIDDEAIDKLAAEFETRSRTRRLRALHVAVAMNAVGDVQQQVIQMLADEDHFLRAEAARTLVHCDTPASRQALRERLLDRSPAVQEAAERTLQAFATSATSAMASLETLPTPAPPAEEPLA
jgi:HEAT repeat protein